MEDYVELSHWHRMKDYLPCIALFAISFNCWSVFINASMRLCSALMPRSAEKDTVRMLNRLRRANSLGSPTWIVDDAFLLSQLLLV